jgi:hypothetical protein
MYINLKIHFFSTMTLIVFSVCQFIALFFVVFFIASVKSEGYDSAITDNIVLFNPEDTSVERTISGSIVNGFKWEIIPIQPWEWADPVALIKYAIEIRSKVPIFVLYPIFFGKTFTRKADDGPLLPILHDTLVFSDRVNQEDGWCGVQVSGTPDNCNFNEIFICPFLKGQLQKKWMNIKTDDFQSEFYRPSQISTWNVKTTTRFIFTKNEFVQMDVLTGGGWNSNCECIHEFFEKSCETHYDVFETISQRGSTRSWRRPDDVVHIACIRVKLITAATCDLTPFRTSAGHLQSRSEANEDKISQDVHLPALIGQVGLIEGATGYEVSKNFDQRVQINGCKAGFASIERPPIGTVCRKANLQKCNTNFMVSCRFKSIADQCHEVFFTNIAARDKCIDDKQKICQEYRVLDMANLNEDICQHTQKVCDLLGLVNHYYDLDTLTCLPCGTSMIDGTIVKFARCEGANEGFQECRREEHYEKLTNVGTTHGCNKVCAGGACTATQYPTSLCGTTLAVAGGEWYLRNDPQICRDCTNNCVERQFATCGGPVTTDKNKLSTCEACFCTQMCNEGEYCFMNPDDCKGDGPNGRSECRITNDVVCNVAYYNRGLTTRRYDSSKTYPYWTIEEVMDDTCVLCVVKQCNYDQFFPQCLTVGVMGQPECQSCTNKPENSEYTSDSLWDSYKEQQDDRSLVRPECMWSCNSGYVRMQDQCVACNTLPSCEPGFKMQCVQEAFSENNQKCLECFDENFQPFCAVLDSVRFFMQQCTQPPGTLYDPANAQSRDDAMFMNLCKPCATIDESSCTETQFFSQCDHRDANRDNSGCVDCVTLLPENAIAKDVEDNRDGIVCDWGCTSDYYRKNDGNVCTPCSQSLEASCFCSGDSCTGLTLVGCNDDFSVSDRVCECLPGYNMNSLGRCIICTNNKFSPGGLSLCSPCPQGHMSNTEVGGTFCVPCPANTYKSNAVCRLCDTGTDGVIGSNVCSVCLREGERAFADIWTGRIKLYGITVGLVATEISDGFIAWSGMIPMTCDGGGTNGTFSICKNNDASSIVTRVMLGTRLYEQTHQTMSPSYTCQVCPSGLAYSTNFDFASAYRNRGNVQEF